MGIKSEKTFEEIVERIVAVFRPHRSSEARDFIDCDLDPDGNGSSNAIISAVPHTTNDGALNATDGTDAQPSSAASQDNPTEPGRGAPPQTEEFTF